MVSRAARRGFNIERRVVEAINSGDRIGLALVRAITEELNLPCERFSARRIPRRKSDIILECDDRVVGISVKLFRPDADYNHVERNFVDHYASRWGLPEQVYVALKLFVGEVDKEMRPIPTDELVREAKRMTLEAFKQEALGRLRRGLLSRRDYESALNKVRRYGRVSPGVLGKIRRLRFTQMDDILREAVKRYFRAEKKKIVEDVLCGDEAYLLVFLVVKRENDLVHYYIIRRREVVEIYSSGDIRFTRAGNLMLGEVVLQRKGGDHEVRGVWRDIAANQLQFKIRPSLAIRGREPLISELLT